MGEASRIPAADKRPEDFEPPKLPPVVKKVVTVSVLRLNGDLEETTVILRPGDALSVDGQQVLEG